MPASSTRPPTSCGCWKRIEALGFDWISVWDHFYGATASPTTPRASRRWRCTPRWPARPSGSSAARWCTRSATATRRCWPRRSRPSTSSPAAAQRWASAPGGPRSSTSAYGIDFPSIGTRMDQLEEGIAVLRGLLARRPRRRSRGSGSRRRRARNEPRPVQAKLPIWVGGGGEKRTLRIAARYADGWNVPFVDPPTFAAKRDVLHRHCADVGRDPAEIRCAVNVGLAWTDDSLHQQFGTRRPRARPGVLGGSVDEVVERIGEYVPPAPTRSNLALRVPFDVDALEQFSEAMSLPPEPVASTVGETPSHSSTGRLGRTARDAGCDHWQPDVAESCASGLRTRRGTANRALHHALELLELGGGIDGVAPGESALHLVLVTSICLWIVWVTRSGFLTSVKRCWPCSEPDSISRSPAPASARSIDWPKCTLSTRSSGISMPALAITPWRKITRSLVTTKSVVSAAHVPAQQPQRAEHDAARRPSPPPSASRRRHDDGEGDRRHQYHRRFDQLPPVRVEIEDDRLVVVQQLARIRHGIDRTGALLG